MKSDNKIPTLIFSKHILVMSEYLVTLCLFKFVIRPILPSAKFWHSQIMCSTVYKFSPHSEFVIHLKIFWSQMSSGLAMPTAQSILNYYSPPAEYPPPKPWEKVELTSVLNITSTFSTPPVSEYINIHVIGNRKLKIRQ